MPKKQFLGGPLASALSKVYPSLGPATIVKSLAVDLLNEVGVRTEGPPFDPFAIARALGIEISYEVIEAEAVFVAEDMLRPKIVLRKEIEMRSEARWRRLNFTLAHEIGHYVIRRTLIGFFPLSQFRNNDSDEEFLCDTFAGELLMPSSIITRDFLALGFAPDVLIELSHKYQVSLRALLCKTTSWAGGTLVSAIWKDVDNGNYRPDWVSPTSYKGMILCDTGRTTVERAFVSGGESQFGRDDVMLNGKRMKWQSVSKALTHGQVLTVMHRKSAASSRFLPLDSKKIDLAFTTAAKLMVPTQQLLPFKQNLLRQSRNNQNQKQKG